MPTLHSGLGRLKLSGRRPSARSVSDAPAAFCRDMLLKASRTFALTVPMLPTPLDNIVGVAYLLCRVADTIEDEADIPASVRSGLLHELEPLVALPPDWREASADFADRACRLLDSSAPADQVSLVAGLPVLLTDRAGRPRPARQLVHKCVHDMATGMAKTALRGESAPGPGPVVADVDGLLEYCDIVAGTVGEMLTGLFAWHSGGVAAALPALEPRALAFGRTLQLTNIIKDVSVDAAAGRCWLPRSILADCGLDSADQLRDSGLAVRRSGVLRRMLSLTLRELDDALAYVHAVPVADTAIRRFCVIQLVMSELTLRKAWEGRDSFGREPVKISRNAVKASLGVTYIATSRPAALSAVFAGLRATLPSSEMSTRLRTTGEMEQRSCHRNLR
jgi:farnesyl-diphosphate farnesyltransferase